VAAITKIIEIIMRISIKKIGCDYGCSVLSALIAR